MANRIIAAVVGRDFIQALERQPVAPEQQALVKKLLLERLSLRGICQVVGVSLDWLLAFLVSVYEELPEHLNVSVEHRDNHVVIQLLEVEVDELLSFVSNKKG